MVLNVYLPIAVYQQTLANLVVYKRRHLDHMMIHATVKAIVNVDQAIVLIILVNHHASVITLLAHSLNHAIALSIQNAHLALVFHKLALVL
jgi:hypothetical protein